MTITILTVGTRPNVHVQALIDEYEKRLPKQIRVSWVFIPHGSGDPRSSKQQEAEAILRKISNNSYVILLDETGKILNSVEHAENLFAQSKPSVVYVIGGAYGVDESIHQRADCIWSLSRLVFPHQLVRVFLAEQVYRAYAIHTNHPYHHE